mgnify:CR=1 FL=1
MPLVSDISGSSAAASKIGITGSVVFAGADPDYAVTFPSVGTDVAFYVSGSIWGPNQAQTVRSSQHSSFKLSSSFIRDTGFSHETSDS